MTHPNKVSAAVLAGVALGLVPVASHGLGFGRPVTRAILGERLQMQVPIRLEAGEDLSADCVATDVYVGDDKLGRSALSVAVDRSVNGGDATLRLQTSGAINEPVVTVYLAAGCQSRVTRKFVLFVDPPELVASQVPQSSASPSGLADEGPSGQAATPSPVRAPRASARARTRSGADTVEAGATESGRRADGLSATLGAASQRPPKSESGNRLVLDPIEQDALVIPSLRAEQVLTTPALDDSPASRQRRAAAAALWQALNASPEQLARDRQRLTELEQRLVAIQAEGDRARAALAQARESADEARTPGWALLALAGLVVVLLPMVGWLGWRLWRAQREQPGSDWMNSAMANEPQDAGVEDDLARTSVDFVRRPEPVPTPESVTVPAPAAPVAPEHRQSTEPVVSAPAQPAVGLSLEPAAVVTAPQSVSLASVAQREALREVSVEELIDLEQQAEFFVVLGQDDAAIDLLEGHVQSTTGGSPLPYLKLLEIYQRLGQRADYERVQSDFNARFNGYAPAWESDLQQGHSLTEYPGVIERLQGLWATPARAMEVLEKSLTRPDQEAETFDLPAYRELLFLYAVARDLSEREARDRPAVDLLLPEVGPADIAVDIPVLDAPEIEPLMATRPIKAQPDVSPTLSLDLHLEDLGGAPPSASGQPGVYTSGPLPSARELEPLPFEPDTPAKG